MNADNPSWYKIEKKRAQLALLPAIVWVVLIWLAFIVDYTGLFAWDFSRLGILPGVADGLIGIIFSPFIHSSFSHLLSNTLPLLILIWFLFYFYSKIAFGAFICLWLSSGFLTWIIGRGSYHVGASGLVFGLLFFLFFSGIFRKYIPLVAVSLIVAFIYGSTIWSIFPITEMVDASISWEGHLSGAVSGLIFAIVFRKQGPQKPEVVWEEEEDETNVPI
ncbi:Membrane associated serine protease, rhomboid family [Porphyromonadaceae bacterium NLAE-zl-C104]|uniref:rhomboid family intramembrane serine protease n=1 Tax=Proteiniphilum saccharofermentans TaxID=1642647 RepID=UPI00089CF70A|nr:rhomboid family intramembrane serine protease [Proteiniphilum saccharofermentans]SEA12632.1 Membrane associated serine protease, rhomboid family [Porphyromonadaceae bacterium KH3R12]SFS92017.1 Membrane associated serine protease, rhomboid family [Porphyromonadaceae bacterium NLAE-zl-C104]